MKKAFLTYLVTWLIFLFFLAKFAFLMQSEKFLYTFFNGGLL